VLDGARTDGDAGAPNTEDMPVCSGTARVTGLQALPSHQRS
jgi:hypothetical protein